jgi:hypothetical protein
MLVVYSHGELVHARARTHTHTLAKWIGLSDESQINTLFDRKLEWIPSIFSLTNEKQSISRFEWEVLL